jgi:hypothetical protein
MSVTTYSCFGETKTISKWALDPRCVVAVETFRKRLADGWSVRDSLETAGKAYRSPYVGQVAAPRTFGNYAMHDPLSLASHMVPPRGTP